MVAPKTSCGMRAGEGVTATSSAIRVAAAEVDNLLYLPFKAFWIAALAKGSITA
jgi:hypothetical protein